MPAKDTEKNNHGKKVVAGKLLSKFIREIASEEYDDPIIKARGEEAVMVTKAEAIARHIWNVALGYVEEIDIYKDGVKVGVKLETHRPDKWAIGIIWDRMEGRVGQADAKSGNNKASLADKVSEQGKKRLSQIAKSSLTSKE
ncbi:hypothetical protein LCGC14_0598320 [marine sediment metagenome]|uniref:Uncharacterized protein n=1 Tax=marine sediment metagenome TaxID=412755 RepID=A0A0F9UJX0_9ZZZZ